MYLQKFFTIHCLVVVLLGSRCSQASFADNEELRSGDRTKRDVNGVSYGLYKQRDYPRDCQEVYDRFNGPPDGVYEIQPDGYPASFEVYCDNTFDSGGWTVFQRRLDGGVSFYRNWEDYKNGFGFLHRDFWLGNEKLAYLTNQKDYELRIDVVNRTGLSYYGQYDLFRITDESTNYTLIELGSYDGNLGNDPTHDYLRTHEGKPFSTLDVENDQSSSRNCAVELHGGWWYHTCYRANLNGEYMPESDDKETICLWDPVYRLQCGIQYTEMKLRPVNSS